MSNRQTTTRRRVLAGSATAVAATVPAMGSTAAQSGSSGGQGVLADGVGDTSDIIAWFGGRSESFKASLSTLDETETLAGRMRNEFNANSDLWLSYGNWLMAEHDVSPIGEATVHVDVVVTRSMREPLREPTTVPTTITTEYDDETGTYVGLEWVDGEPEANPTYQFAVEDYAAQKAADELQTFRRRYIGESTDDHEIPETEYLSKLAGRHAGNIGFGKESRHVLELLLGET